MPAATLNTDCQNQAARLGCRMSAPPAPALQWLRNGREIFAAMLEAIRLARVSIRLETYIYANGASGRQFLATLVTAVQRGVRVRVLVDAFGSWELPNNFFAPLLA